MPWKQTTPMPERRSCIALSQTRLWSLTERCTRFTSSRQTGDKWLRRYAQAGCSGLQERSRAPLSCPQRSAPAVAAVLWEAKPRHPSWGPRQIWPSLARHHPLLEWPAASRAGARCRHAGRSRSTPRRRRPQPPGAPTLHADAPHAVWTADGQGPFRTGDGVDGAPLTGAAASWRALLGGIARLSPPPVAAPPVCARLCREEGRPEAMRTANGPPLATPACCGRATRRVWWLTLSSPHQRLEPGRPAPHGRHERRHRTLTAAATRPPEQHPAAQQARFDRGGREYHPDRPHEALGQRTPAARYHASPRPMPAKRAEPESPGHGLVRRVRNAGTCRWKRRQLVLSDTWRQDGSALDETGDGLWSIDVYAVLLARLDDRDFTLRG
jgi:putative transposase